MLKAPRRKVEAVHAQKERYVDTLSFRQAIELLQALTNSNMVNDDATYLNVVKALSARVSEMNFDNFVNELKYDEYKTLYSAYVNMKYSDSQKLRNIFDRVFKSESLTRAFENRNFSEFHYAEYRAGSYDPLKPRVIGGLSESLVKANLQDLKVLQENQADGMYKEMFPYEPDLLLGLEGQKVGVFVLNDDEVMRDSLNADGFADGKMRIVEQAHRLQNKLGASEIKSVGLPVKRVVDANLQEHKLSLREDFTIQAFMDESGLTNRIENPVSILSLQNFCTNLASLASVNWASTTGAFEEFMQQLLFVVRTREKMDTIYEHE